MKNGRRIVITAVVIGIVVFLGGKFMVTPAIGAYSTAKDACCKAHVDEVDLFSRD